MGLDDDDGSEQEDKQEPLRGLAAFLAEAPEDPLWRKTADLVSFLHELGAGALLFSTAGVAREVADRYDGADWMKLVAIVSGSRSERNAGEQEKAEASSSDLERRLSRWNDMRPLAAARLIQGLTPVAEAFVALGELDPALVRHSAGATGVSCSEYLAARGKRLQDFIEAMRRVLEKNGFVLDGRGGIKTLTPRGARPKLVNRIVVDLYVYLSQVAEIYGNPKSLREDIQTLLRPTIDLSDERIRIAIDNHLKRARGD